MELTINIPFRPAYVSDSGIQPPVPQTVVTVEAPHGPQYIPLSDSVWASTLLHFQHPLSARVHRIADGHRVQRIAGLPLSWVERAPRAKRLTWRESHEPFDQLDFADVPWDDDANDRTPLDMPDDGVDPCLPLKNFDSHGVRVSEYYGFDGRDTKAPALPRGRHSRPQQLDPSDLERMADQILEADDANQLRPTIATQKMDLPRDDRKPWPITQRTSPSDWRYLPYTYTLGWKDCPRCHGVGRPFGQKPCRYCSQQGGWQITRTSMTPWHPEHGWALTPPLSDDWQSKEVADVETAMRLMTLGERAGYSTRFTRQQGGVWFFWRNRPKHTHHTRTRAAKYGGNVRVRKNTRPSEAIMAEIRRRHFAYTTRRQLAALAVAENRQAIAA